MALVGGALSTNREVIGLSNAGNTAALVQTGGTNTLSPNGQIDIGQDAGAPYIVSELLEGETLREQLKAGPLPVRKAVGYAVQIAQGLAAAHEKGIVHRDLKPDNILLVERGEDRAFVKIVDFGTSKIQPLTGKTAPLSLTRHGVAVGTPLYMSPEQARSPRDVDARSDLYSLGCTLYFALAGRAPFEGGGARNGMG